MLKFNQVMLENLEWQLDKVDNGEYRKSGGYKCERGATDSDSPW
jgi:hypothetical protein